MSKDRALIEHLIEFVNKEVHKTNPYIQQLDANESLNSDLPYITTHISGYLQKFVCFNAHSQVEYVKQRTE